MLADSTALPLHEGRLSAPEGQWVVPVGTEPSVELVRAAMANDRGAQRALIKRYERPLFSWIARAGNGNADDLSQEVFLKMLRALPRYRPGPIPFSAWIFRIAARTLIDSGRAKARAPESLTEKQQSQLASTGSPEHSAQVGERLSLLERLMERLVDQQRHALLLVHVQGMTLREAAHVLGCKEQTIKTRVHRGREHLKAWLSEAESELP